MWDSGQLQYYHNGVHNSFDTFLNELPSDHKTSTTGTLEIGHQSQGDENIQIEFSAGTVANIRIRGQVSNSVYAFWTGSQWEGQTMANGKSSLGRFNMENSPLIWTNNDETYADLNIVPPTNATQCAITNGDGKSYVLVELVFDEAEINNIRELEHDLDTKEKAPQGSVTESELKKDANVDVTPRESATKSETKEGGLIVYIFVFFVLILAVLLYNFIFM